jgi:hypothetical protein
MLERPVVPQDEIALLPFVDERETRGVEMFEERLDQRSAVVVVEKLDSVCLLFADIEDLFAGSRVGKKNRVVGVREIIR